MPPKNLLLLTDFFPPGYRSGGPARSCYNLALGLSDEVQVRVITRDTDLGERASYSDIEPYTWINLVGKAYVYYCSRQEQGIRAMYRKLRQSGKSVFYLNSMFSVPFTIYPLLFHWLGWIKGRMVLAPRGMLKPSALQFKPAKKKVFLALFRILSWHKRLVFHATSVEEAKDIRQVFAGADVRVCDIVPDLALLKQRTEHSKTAAFVRFCMVGRIHPIKNIDKALQALAHLSGSDVLIDVIGPFENSNYYETCKDAAAALPSGIRVVFHGALPRHDIMPILQRADFFYLLTQGENFGHAIFESLALGKPVIISDQTPWRGLEARKAGWDIDLEDTEALIHALNTATQMPNDEYQEWSSSAHACAQTFVNQSDWKKSYLELFGIENPVID